MTNGRRFAHVDPTYYFLSADVYTHSQRFSTTRQLCEIFDRFQTYCVTVWFPGNRQTSCWVSLPRECTLFSTSTVWNLYFDLQKLYVFCWFTTTVTATGRANDDGKITQTYYRNPDTDGRHSKKVSFHRDQFTYLLWRWSKSTSCSLNRFLTRRRILFARLAYSGYDLYELKPFS